MIGQVAFLPVSGPLGQMAAGPLPPVMPTGDPQGKGEDLHGKIRKPYTITKQRENWTEQEHNKFLKALELFDRDWRKIEEYVGTKTVIQIRSHAQKYFLKVQKLGQDAHVPPPRPKRKSTQPYPQKASKVVAAAQAAQQAAAASSKGYSPQESPYSGKAFSPQDGPYASSGFSPQMGHAGGLHAAVPPQTPQEEAAALASPAWGPEQPSKGWGFVINMLSVWPSLQPANPDFAKVYRFLGNVFEVGVAGNLQKLKGMPPIDRETIILLMRNLAINLASPVFAEQQHILALADSSARSQQLEEQAQPRLEQGPQSAPPTPSDTSTSPRSKLDLGPTGGALLESPRYREDPRHWDDSPLYNEGGVKGRAFDESVPLGLGLGLGVAPMRGALVHEKDRGPNAASLGDEVRLKG